jgi:transcriptional regulator with XRE-family HTH domain
MGDQILFGRKIRTIRKAGKLSREGLAERAAINPNYLGEIERGEKWPSLQIIGALAKALSVPSSEFFTYDSQETNLNQLKSKIRQMIENRKVDEVQRAFRVLKALLEP